MIFSSSIHRKKRVRGVIFCGLFVIFGVLIILGMFSDVRNALVNKCVENDDYVICLLGALDHQKCESKSENFTCIIDEQKSAGVFEQNTFRRGNPTPSTTKKGTINDTIDGNRMHSSSPIKDE